jgi:DNA replication protein DnaC
MGVQHQGPPASSIAQQRNAMLVGGTGTGKTHWP